MKSTSLEKGILSNYDYKRLSVRIAVSLLGLFIFLVCLLTLYPFVVTLLNSLKSNQEVFIFPVKYVPEKLIWHNYISAWRFLDIWHYLKNTLMLITGNIVISLIFIGFAAFSLTHMEVPKRKWFILFFMSTMLIPPSTYVIPNFLNLKSLGLLNTFWAFWLPSAANAFYLLLIRSFFGSIHSELFESSRIDGASELRCFFQIAVPLSKPILITLTIFYFINGWNDWFWPSLVMQKEDLYPIATAVNRYIIPSYEIQWNVKFAVTVILLIPPMLFFALFQKYIISGINVGGVKG